MLETAPRELMVLVERVVRPLPIPLTQQKRLRKEFLNHLQTIYTEELNRDNDPAAALTRAQKRFGNPQELITELRSAIPWWQRWESWSEWMMARRPLETEMQYALRMAGRFGIFISSVMALMMLDHHFFGTERLSLLKLQVAAAAVAFLVIWLTGFLSFGLQIGKEWEQPRRRWAWIVAWSTGLLASWPISLMAMMKIAGGSWSDYSIPLISSIVAGLLSVVCGTMIGAVHHRETQYRREWAELELKAA